MLARDLWPNPSKDIVGPSRELPIEPFIQRPEEAENFDDVRSRLGVEVHSIELINEVVH